jgi:hypothetical protein
MIDGFFQILENGVRCGRQTLHQPNRKKWKKTQHIKFGEHHDSFESSISSSQLKTKAELSTKNSQQPRKKENRTLHTPGNNILTCYPFKNDNDDDEYNVSSCTSFDIDRQPFIGCRWFRSKSTTTKSKNTFDGRH